MGWKDLVQERPEELVLPWTGGRVLERGPRRWRLDGAAPDEHGWWRFSASGRTAALGGPAEPDESVLGWRTSGYLVGDRMLPDSASAGSERVHLLERGLERFSRAVAGRASGTGPLIYVSPDMPQGPEPEVLRAFQDRMPDVGHVKGVHPALAAAYAMEVRRREEADRRREAAETARREELERLEREARREDMRLRLGDGASRRAMAATDFGAAARAALTVGGAEYLDHRPCSARGEMAVTFRLEGRRFECTCDERTLRIIDSGICLVDGNTGVRGDELFTLESLPPVIREADRRHVLHVFRHVDGGED